jgi:hypothetical protein
MREPRLNITVMLAGGLLVTFAGCASPPGSNVVVQMLPYNDHVTARGGAVRV